MFLLTWFCLDFVNLVFFLCTYQLTVATCLFINNLDTNEIWADLLRHISWTCRLFLGVVFVSFLQGGSSILETVLTSRSWSASQHGHVWWTIGLYWQRGHNQRVKRNLRKMRGIRSFHRTGVSKVISLFSAHKTSGGAFTLPTPHPDPLSCTACVNPLKIDERKKMMATDKWQQREFEAQPYIQYLYLLWPCTYYLS